MEPNTEQTNAVDAAQGLSETDNSGDSDLNSLLAEYEEGANKAEPKAETPKPERTVVQPDLSKLDPVIDFVKTKMQEDQRKTFDEDVDSAVERMAAEEAFKGVPKTLVEDAIISHAFKNKDFDKAFQNRADNPNAWDAAQKAASDVLAERFKDLPRQEEPTDNRDDIEAAKATVAGVQDASDKDDGPSITDRRKMSDTAWRNYTEERIAAAS